MMQKPGAGNRKSNSTMPAALHIGMASPEIVPFAKTGGLADMACSLAKALEKLGLKISLIMPAYRSVLQGGFTLKDTGFSLKLPVSSRQESGSVLQARMGKTTAAYFIRADRYFDREYLYTTPEGDYPDNAERFIFFSRSILEVLRTNPPHILHAHDWQSALSIAFLKTQPQLYPELAQVKTAFTVHNLGYQGIFPPTDWPLLNLDESFRTPQYLEFYNKINFLKGGLVLADVLTTVSPTYAEEIMTPEYGFGLEGVFQQRSASLHGILNGADYEIWSPESDPFISSKYSPDNLSGKRVCKVDLQRFFHIPENPDIPLLGMVSRLSAQKGVDLIKEVMEELFSQDLQFVLLGTGDKQFEELTMQIAARYPSKFGISICYDEFLAHKIIAGADIFLMPSLYEPSGLTQIYSLKYGTIPVVRATGGLKDTIQDFNAGTGQGNGFVFGPYNVSCFLEAISRAIRIFHQEDAWTILMKNAMRSDFSWERSARAYLDLYQGLISG